MEVDVDVEVEMETNGNVGGCGRKTSWMGFDTWGDEASIRSREGWWGMGAMGREGILWV